MNLKAANSMHWYFRTMSGISNLQYIFPPQDFPLQKLKMYYYMDVNHQITHRKDWNSWIHFKLILLKQLQLHCIYTQMVYLWKQKQIQNVMIFYFVYTYTIETLCPNSLHIYKVPLDGSSGIKTFFISPSPSTTRSSGSNCSNLIGVESKVLISILTGRLKPFASKKARRCFILRWDHKLEVFFWAALLDPWLTLAEHARQKTSPYASFEK